MKRRENGSAFDSVERIVMQAQVIDSENAGLIAANAWIQQLGKKPITLWRWRNRGWIETINICGRLYISRAEIARFTKRAEAGEFQSEHKAPGVKKAEAAMQHTTQN